MKPIVATGLSTLLLFSSLSANPDEIEHIDSVVSGLRSAREIVKADLHPIDYLHALKVENPKTILNGWQRYELARSLLDCHHLCEALMHQSYAIRREAPIIQLAKHNFAGFEKCQAEDGYITSRIADYFERGTVEWGVDSTFGTQIQKAEQGGAGQPATAPESKPEGKEEPKSESEGRSQ